MSLVPRKVWNAVFFLKERVVVLRRIERRVQIHEIDALVLQIPPQDVEIITVIKRAHAPSLAGPLPESNGRQSSFASRCSRSLYSERILALEKRSSDSF